MNPLKQLLGILLIVLAWLDPFELGTSFQVLFFILGFDLVGFFMQIVIFAADMLLGISDLGWHLIIFIMVEGLFYFLKIKTLFSYVVKPLVVFGIIFMGGFGWELGVIVGGIDLLLNVGKKYI